MGLASAVINLGRVVDSVAPTLGVSESALTKFDAAVTTVAGAAENENPIAVGAAAAIGTLAVMAIAPEALAAGVTALVGEEAVMGATTLLDEAIALNAPAVFNVTSGSAIVATTSASVAGVYVGEKVSEASSEAITSAAEALSPSDKPVVASAKSGPVNISSGDAAVIAQADTVSVASSAGAAVIGNNNTINLAAGAQATVDGDGNTINLNSGSTITTAGSNTITDTIGANTFSDTVANAQAVTDAAGNATFISALNEGGSDFGSLTLSASGAESVFTADGVSVDFAQGLLSSVSSGGDGNFDFRLNSGVAGVGEDLQWNATTESATLNMTDASGQTTSALLGTSVTGDTLQVSDATASFVDISGQELSTTTMNDDGSFTTSTPDDTGVSSYTYNNLGQITSYTRTNDDGSYLSDVYNPTNGVVAQQAIGNVDGSFTAIYNDPDTGATEQTWAFDSKGNIIAESTAPNIDLSKFAGHLASALSTQIIAQFISKNNVPATLVAKAFSKAGIQAVEKYLNNQAESTDTFADNVATNLANMAGGMLGSDLGTDLFKALGLPTVIGSKLGGIALSTATQQLTNYISRKVLGLAVDGTNLLDDTETMEKFEEDLGGALGTAGLSLAGAELTTELEKFLEPNGNTEGEAIGGSIGSTIGTVVGSFFGVPLIGGSIGTFIGSLIGGLFGPGPSVGPNAVDQINFNQTSQAFFDAGAYQDKGGPIDLVRQMGAAETTVVNAMLKAIGGQVTGTVPHNLLGYIGGHYFFVLGNINGPQDAFPIQFSNPTDAINYGIVNTLRTLNIQGGDPYMKYALWASNATTADALSYDLNVAADYSRYVSNPLAFDIGLTLSNDPTQFAAWQAEYARAMALGLDKFPGDVTNISNTYVSGPDGSIALTSTTASFANGTSQVALFNLINGICTCVQSFTGTNGTGALIGAVLNITGGANSQTVISNDFNAIQDLVATSKVSAINLMDDGDINMSITQAIRNYQALSLIKNRDYNIDLSGDADISANFDALQNLAAAGNVSAINLLQTGDITLTAAQVANDYQALSLIKNRSFNLNISGSAADIAGIMDVLQNLVADGHISAIRLPNLVGPTTIMNGSNEVFNSPAVGTYLIMKNGNTLNGATNSVVCLSDSLSATVAGNNVTIYLGNHDSLNYIGSGAWVYVDTMNSTAAMQLANSQIYLANNIVASVTGNNDAIHAATGDTITLSAGDTGDVISVSAITGNTTTFSGTTEKVTVGTDAIVVTKGAQATLQAADGTMTINNAYGTAATIVNVIDWKKGGSQSQQFSGLASTIKEQIQDFTGADKTGKLVDTITDFTNGSSRKQIYAGLASTMTSEDLTYSGTNLAGTLTSEIFNLKAGGSQEKILTGLTAGWSAETENFTGADATGTETDSIVNYTAGGSAHVLFAGLVTGVLSEQQNCSGANLTGSLTEVITNYKAGNSQVELLSPTSTITSEYERFSSVWGAGTETQNIVNYKTGNSQKQIFTGLASTMASEYLNYSGANATGTLTSEIFNLKAGGSQEKILTGLTAGWSAETENFTGVGATGTETDSIVNYTAGGSAHVLSTGLATGVLSVQQNYSGANLTGSETEIITNYTAGGSQVELVKPSTTIASEYEIFTGSWGTGTDIKNIINWTAGGSEEQLYTSLAAGVTSETLNYAGANATGTLASRLFLGTTNNDVLVADKTGHETLIGNGGTDTYDFARGDGQDIIQNGVTTNKTATGELDLATGIATNQIWLQKSGNDLVVDIMGTKDQVTIAGWFTSTASQVKEIKTADGNMIDSQLTQLVQAMATYSAAHTSFNPTATSAVPTDATLQTALAAAWHH